MEGQQQPKANLGNLRKKLSEFQAIDHKVNLDAKVDMQLKSGRRVKYDYCTYSNLVSKIRPGLAKCKIGFSHEIIEDQGGVKLKTTVFEGDGGEGEISSTLTIGDFGNPQDFASRTTYAKRYSLAMLLGVSIDTDNDAQDVEPKQIKKPKSSGQEVKRKVIQQMTASQIKFVSTKIEAGMSAEEIISAWEKVEDLTEQVKEVIRAMESQKLVEDKKQDNE